MQASDVAGLVSVVVAGAALVPTMLAVTKGFTRAVDRERQQLSDELLPQEEATRIEGTQEEQDSTKFTKLLIRYYAYGLTQARASFFVSLGASLLGGAVLIAGVALAIFRADTIGKQYASIVASVAGLLTGIIGALFHKRADAALRHMESQTASLRQDMNAQRDLDQAIALLDQEEDEPIKAHLRAALILKLSAAKLPELKKFVADKSPEPSPQSSDGLPG
ncbi:hypothetical protein ACFRH4_08690 [Streptomyces mirabilis]|uniref:TRADD-N-associated membrane domain-containing protein n=1 Tax=Streptomyces mirabilis TaxID=68239 RepID=UPI003680B604